jgi:hypothetical protein
VPVTTPLRFDCNQHPLQCDLKKEFGIILGGIRMDHVVYVDANANELDRLLDGSKKMIIRGAMGRKLPYGRVNENDVLYFINNDGSGLIKAKGVVESVHNSDKMSKEESTRLVKKNQDRLNLIEKQFKRWAGKRYIVLIEVSEVEPVSPFKIDRSNFGNMDDWLPVGNIKKVIIEDKQSNCSE